MATLSSFCRISIALADVRHDRRRRGRKHRRGRSGRLVRLTPARAAYRRRCGCRHRTAPRYLNRPPARSPERRNRRWRAIKLAPAMVRYDDSVGAELDCGLRVFDIQNAFDDQLARPGFLDPLNILPIQRRIELAVGPLRPATSHPPCLSRGRRDCRRSCSCSQHAECPGWLGGNVEDIPQADFRRHRHAILDVAVALAEHLQIDGEHQRIAFAAVAARDKISWRNRGRGSHRAETKTAGRSPQLPVRSNRSTWWKG